MRKDHFLLVEGVMKDLPKIKKALYDRRQWLEVLAVCGCPSDVRVDGGNFVPVQERFAASFDESFLKKLERIVDVIYNAYAALSEKEQRIIGLCCFRQLSLSEACSEIDVSYGFAQRLKTRAFEKMVRPCIEVFSDVECWREYEQDEMELSVKLLSDDGKASGRDTRKSHQCISSS